LALAGGLTLLGTTHQQYFHDDGDGITLRKKQFAMAQNSKRIEPSQVSLFGESSDVQIEEPVVATL
jgi:DNA polymerase-3 subunit alpha